MQKSFLNGEKSELAEERPNPLFCMWPTMIINGHMHWDIDNLRRLRKYNLEYYQMQILSFSDYFFFFFEQVLTQIITKSYYKALNIKS